MATKRELEDENEQLKRKLEEVLDITSDALNVEDGEDDRDGE